MCFKYLPTCASIGDIWSVQNTESTSSRTAVENGSLDGIFSTFDISQGHDEHIPGFGK